MRCEKDENLLFNRNRVQRSLDYAAAFADSYYCKISESAYVGIRHSYFHKKLSLVHILNELLCTVDQLCDSEHDLCAHEGWWLAGSIASFLMGLTKETASVSVYLPCSGCWGLGGTVPPSLSSVTSPDGPVTVAKFSIQSIDCNVICVPFNPIHLGDALQRPLMYDLFICHVMACFDVCAARCALRFDAQKIGNAIKPCERETHVSPYCVHHYQIDFFDLTTEVPKAFLPRSVCNVRRLRKYLDRQIYQPMVRGPTAIQSRVLQRMFTFLEHDN